MEYSIYSHRYGREIIESTDEVKIVFEKFCEMLTNIRDDEIIKKFEEDKERGNQDKSISKVLNKIIREELIKLEWVPEARIFKEGAISNSSDWRLDFVYEDIFSLEVAFNHASATTINLLKPTLASELNHVEKEFQTKFSIIITATNDLKKLGGFDNAIGTYEGYCSHTKPLMNQLTTPMVIIGLKAPISFCVKHRKENGKNIGEIVPYADVLKLVE